VSATPELDAEFLDGRSARALPVRVSLHAGELLIRGDGVERREPLARVRWPERQRHGARRIVFDDGATLRCTDAAAFDAFARAAGARESFTVRAQQSWRLTLTAVLLLLALVAVGYRWGVPAAARGVLAFVPATIDARVGDSAYDTIAGWFLQPTRIAAERQQALRQAFEQAIRRAHPQGLAVVPRLRFHAAARLGPNAFALPGGTIVITDELLQRLEGRDDVVLGVLAHELGHVRLRHGMRLLVQATVLGAAASVAFGDFSGLLAGAPALLGQLGYSRDFEREADDEAIAVLRASGISPAVMVVLFEAMARPAERAGSAASGASAPSRPARTREADAPVGADLGIAFSSHPPDAERMARFRAAAAAR
jgi:Zn-dependent protease with chaperone function